MRFMLLQNYGEVGSGCPPMNGVDAGGHQGPHRLPDRAQRGADRARRAGRRPGPGRARARPSSSSSDGADAPRWSPTARSPSPRSCWPATAWSTSRRSSGPSRSRPRPRRRPGRTARRSGDRIEVRQVHERPRPRGVTAGGDIEGLLRELAPQVLGCGRPPLRRLRRRRGRRAGGADRRRRRQWPADGVPDNPLGWLIRVGVPAHDRPVPQRRRPPPPGGPGRLVVDAGRRPSPAAGEDDTLMLLFMCCHPSLTPASAIALTLRAVGGLTTAEIAARVPRPRGDDGAADQPGQGQGCKASDEPFAHAVGRSARPSGCDRCCTCCTCCSTRATPAAPAPTWPGPICRARRSG